MKVKTKSWHYRMNLWRHPKWKVESKKTLCSYFWFTVWNLVFISFFAVTIIAVFYMVGLNANLEFIKHGYNAFSIPYIGHIIVFIIGIVFVAIIVALAFSIIGAIYFASFLKNKYSNYRDSQKANNQQKQPGLVSSYIKAKKEKFCPIIEFKD